MELFFFNLLGEGGRGNVAMRHILISFLEFYGVY